MIYITENQNFTALETELLTDNLTGFGDTWQQLFYTELHDLIKWTFPQNDFQEDILSQLRCKHFEMLINYSKGNFTEARQIVKKYILPLLALLPTKRGNYLRQLAEANLYQPYPTKTLGFKNLLNILKTKI